MPYHLLFLFDYCKNSIVETKHFEEFAAQKHRQVCQSCQLKGSLTQKTTETFRYYERYIDKENGLIYIVMEYCQGI